MNKFKFNQILEKNVIPLICFLVLLIFNSCGNSERFASNREDVYLEKTEEKPLTLKEQKQTKRVYENIESLPPANNSINKAKTETTNEPAIADLEISVEEDMEFEMNAFAETEVVEEILFDRAPKKQYTHAKEKKSNAESYQAIEENRFKHAGVQPLSTFSIDVDNAAYANVRRYLTSYNQLPPVDAVRIEEMINYFDYDYPSPTNKDPFSVYTEMGECPWNRDHQLVHIGIQGKKLDYENLKASNLVFLVDCSGSMNAQNKLPLLKESFKKLLNNLGRNDRVAIVAYAGAAGLVLPSTSANERSRILSALNSLSSGGSTAGGAGIQLAYKIASENFIEEGNNRIILATDGDFNVGTTNNQQLVKMIEEKRKSGIYLTICGFGMGNYKDDRMEMISNAGNGNYFYIDNHREAEKVFVKDMRANMFTLAKDVKIQVEFNPKLVQSYRLIGYENRVLANRDFNDDSKDAGELGAGHTVTALYEIIPVDNSLKYKKKSILDFSSDEMLTVRLRYKPENKSKSILIDNHVVEATDNHSLSKEFRFSAAVAGFGLILRKSDQISPYYSYNNVLEWAEGAKFGDTYKHEFIDLVKKAANLNNMTKESWRN